MPVATSNIKGIRSNRHQDGGFTLIELLIVIVILGILAGVVAFSLSGATNQATKSACQSDAKTVVTAAAAAVADNPGVAIAQSDLTGSTLNGAPFLQSWPNSSSYSIVLESTSGSAGAVSWSAGDVVVKNSSGTEVGNATTNPSGACAI